MYISHTALSGVDTVISTPTHHQSCKMVQP
jgi:hypothetical protein